MIENGSSSIVGLWGLLVLVSLSTYVWRAGGVAIAARIKPDGDLSQWFSCVAYGMLAALMSRIVILPVGILAETLLIDRLVALGAGVAMFCAFKRNMLAGLLSSVAVFAVIAALRENGIV